jgi:hypothetical protein
MLVDKCVADEFLSKYKKLFWFLNEQQEPENLNCYVDLRPRIFEKEKKFNRIVGDDFCNSIESAVFGKFVFLKKYKNGYIFQNVETEIYYQVYGLNSPLEQLTEEYSIIETAILPFNGMLVCDGLIARQGITIGKNMAKEIREGYWLAKKSGNLVVNA